MHNARLDNVELRASAYSKRLTQMYASDIFKEHNIYSTMNVVHRTSNTLAANSEMFGSLKTKGRIMRSSLRCTRKSFAVL